MSTNQFSPGPGEFSIFNTAPGGLSVGWGDVETALDHEKLGSFLKLKDGEAAIITFIGEPASYTAHRVPKIDAANGMPVTSRDGKQEYELRACRALFGEDCPDCAANHKTSRRTLAPVGVIMMNPQGRITGVTPSVFEGGPQVWKMRVMPVIKEWSPSYQFRIQRKGTQLNTDYTFTAIAKGTITPALQEMIDKLEIPSLAEVIRLGIPE